jgi:predicted type IV restriction endonuclease
MGSFMSTGQNEAFSRILIDKALEFSGWNLPDPKQVIFELHTVEWAGRLSSPRCARPRLVRA